MVPSYATLTDFKEWLTVSDSADDGDLQRSLDAATQWIENMCGRVFRVDTANQTHVYYPNTNGDLELVDLVSVSSISLDSRGDRSWLTTLATTDYELLPVNLPRYDRVRIWPTSSRTFGPRRLVQLIGKFGYAEDNLPPAAVRMACLILASRFWKRNEAPFGVLGSTDLGSFERITTIDPDVKSLLDPYRVSATLSGSFVMV